MKGRKLSLQEVLDLEDGTKVWVEEEKESTLIMYGEIIESMANEIARHRYPNKYEYDDKLIESIIKEFS